MLLISSLCGWWAAAPASAQEARPLSERAPVRALDAVARRAMPAVNNEALQTQHPVGGTGPLRVAEPLDVTLTPETDGTWEQLDDGTWIWRLRIRSEEAVSLSLGFTRYRMPNGGQLFVYRPDRSAVRGPFTADDNAAHGELWTPLLHSDELVVEVVLPPDQRDALDLTLGRVNHGFRALTAHSAAKASGSCNIDVACDEANGWRDPARAVARYTLKTGVLCSGVLVNNTAGDQTPYFLTADHCGVTPDNAASMVVYWNFENSFCRAPDEDGGRGDGSLDEFTSGAIHRAAYGFGSPTEIAGRPDFTLVELDEPIDTDYDVYFAGWSREDAPTPRSVGIHHPQGEEKRISFDDDPSTITSYLNDTVDDSGPTHLRVDKWEAGTTEGGSSGSPLFNPDRQVVGLLSGGFAACGNDAADWYGRIAVAWDGGGTPDTRLRDWLDPAGLNPLTHPGINQEIDTVPPAPLTDFTVDRVSSDGIALQWTATGDDGFEGTASLYELRYATAPIADQAAFDTAQVVSSLPLPQPSGANETFTVEGLRPNTPYYFALRARDNGNNVSPLATTTTNAVILNDRFVVRSPYPNPFRTTATVGFAVDDPQRVRANLYDATGRHVQALYDDTLPANSLQRIQIDGQQLASGVYFVHFTGNRFKRTVQVVHVR